MNAFHDRSRIPLERTLLWGHVGSFLRDYSLFKDLFEFLISDPSHITLHHTSYTIFVSDKPLSVISSWDSVHAMYLMQYISQLRSYALMYYTHLKKQNNHRFEGAKNTSVYRCTTQMVMPYCMFNRWRIHNLMALYSPT